MTKRLEGKVALITGGASGFGEASARLFVEEGARVLLADVQHERGARLAKELGEAALYQPTDVTEEADIAAAVDRAVAELGGLDCMFANAGINNDLFDSVRELHVSDKQELYEYLRYDLSQIFFSPNYV